MPDADYLKGWGLPASLYEEQFDVRVWPENWPAWCLFDALQTQWRTGPGGVIGLDYSVLADEMRARDIPAADHDWLRADVRLMEAAALQEIHAHSDR